MYYTQPQQPQNATQTTWARPHHPGLGHNPHSQLGHAPGPPPTSPGFTLFQQQQQQHSLPHHQTMHHHQNSLSHYPSPPPTSMLHPGQHLSNGSPGTNTISQHWSQQLLKCDASRQSRSPHHRARASAMTARSVAKSAIPITNPNAIKITPLEGDAAALANGDAASSVSANAAAAAAADSIRTTTVTPPQNNWVSLDMGGVNIKQIPPTSSLFSFNFLINLYLNHNSLTSLPPQLSRLRHLQLLDLSGNQLSSIPAEMGMLTSLKELYLFDNHLVNLPHELGTLHNLQTLGIEGNPLEEALKGIIQKDGTPALIAYLRDSCPVPPPPPTREWKHFLTPAERVTLDADQSTEIFSVVSYNILCEKAATERMYGYTPSWALAWSYRKDLILTEIMNYDADFLCLQEVDVGQYEDYFTPNLKAQGYEGVHWPKARYKTMSEADRRMVDGCATFYKSSKFTLIDKKLIEFSSIAMQRQDFKKTDDMFNRVLGHQHMAIVCLLEAKETGTRFVIANAHLHWDTNFRDVKLVQTALLIEEMESVTNNFAKLPSNPISSPPEDGSRPQPPTYSDGSKIPLIICGDFNSVAGSGVYDLLLTGTVPPDHPDFMSHVYGKYTSEGLKHNFNLRSAYAPEDMLLTNFTPTFHGVLDYIWYGSGAVACNSILGEIDRGYLDKVVGFPNAHFPSDHVCIAAEFRIKQQKDTTNGTATTTRSASTNNFSPKPYEGT